MVASRQVEIPLYRSSSRQRGLGLGALAQVIGKTAIHFLRKIFVPAAKRVGADLEEFAAPEIAEVLIGVKNSERAAKSVGKQTSSKHLDSGSKKRLQAESFQESLQNRPVGREETILQTFLKIIPSNFRYQPFVAVYGCNRRKVAVFDDLMSSREHQNYPTTSLNENCIEFQFQSDRNHYVDLRPTYLVLELKFVKGRDYETYKSKEVKNGRKEEAQADEETAEVENRAPVPLFLSLLM